jgi:uncharacterized membrane protein
MKYTYKPDDDDGNDDDQNEAADTSGGASGSTETALGINQNLVGALAYVMGWVTGVAFLVIEKENSFVRFHAMQSIAVFVPLTIASFLLGFVPIIGPIFSILLSLVGAALWLFLMFQAFLGIRFKVPYVGDFAEKQLGNTGRD